MFQTPYISIDEHGINLIKNHVVETHIDYWDIRQITITRGFILNHWIWVLAIGILVLAGSLFWGISNIRDFDFAWGDTSYNVRGFFMFQMVPWLLALGSLFLIYTSLRKSKLLMINTYNKRYQVSILEIEKEHKVAELADFLSRRVKLISNNKI